MVSNIQEAIKEIDEMIGHAIGPYGEEPECDNLRRIKKLLESEPESTEYEEWWKKNKLGFTNMNKGDCKDAWDSRQKEIDRLTAEIEKLIEYARHKSNCARYKLTCTDREYEECCTCGLEQALTGNPNDRTL